MNEDYLAIHNCLAKLDVRVSVLEAKAESGEHQFADLKNSMTRVQDDVEAMRDRVLDNLSAIHGDLTAHIAAEQADKIKLLRGQVGVIVSVVTAFALLFMEMWWGK
mgnify:CR=1 FL=1